VEAHTRESQGGISVFELVVRGAMESVEFLSLLFLFMKILEKCMWVMGLISQSWDILEVVIETNLMCQLIFWQK